MLGLRGRFVDAVRSIGRGEEAMEGHPIAIPIA
jgi:hypothetical protein